MELRLLLHVEFNRPIDLEKDYIVAGGFEMVMNGKSVEFDFHNQYHNLVNQSPTEDIITLYNPDYSDFPDFRNITVEDLKNVTEIRECCVYLGEPGESDLKVVSVKNIYFTIIDDKYEAIAVSSKVIDEYNDKSRLEEHIVKAAFTSVWDGNSITTACTVNAVTREIIHIEKSPVEIQGSCKREFVTVNGEEFEAHGSHNLENNEDEYWYDAEPAWFVRLDTWDRPVYAMPDGKFVKDIDSRPQFAPSLHYCVDNDIDGEPDLPVNVAVKLLPRRITG